MAEKGLNQLFTLNCLRSAPVCTDVIRQEGWVGIVGAVEQSPSDVANPREAMATPTRRRTIDCAVRLQMSKERQRQLVHWCFEPSQPLGIISGLKETFINRHIVERTSKQEIRPEEQNEKTESCLENLWNERQLKGP